MTLDQDIDRTLSCINTEVRVILLNVLDGQPLIAREVRDQIADLATITGNVFASGDDPRDDYKIIREELNFLTRQGVIAKQVDDKHRFHIAERGVTYDLAMLALRSMAFTDQSISNILGYRARGLKRQSMSTRFRVLMAFGGAYNPATDRFELSEPEKRSYKQLLDNSGVNPHEFFKTVQVMLENGLIEKKEKEHRGCYRIAPGLLEYLRAKTTGLPARKNVFRALMDDATRRPDLYTTGTVVNPYTGQIAEAMKDYSRFSVTRPFRQMQQDGALIDQDHSLVSYKLTPQTELLYNQFLRLAYNALTCQQRIFQGADYVFHDLASDIAITLDVYRRKLDKRYSRSSPPCTACNSQA
ncbi:MAG: hypothetical protein KJ922_04780 [Nanoarchaeota archaeon]|nr:hypothetical protein [Nanoarchaeota archaeon]